MLKELAVWGVAVVGFGALLRFGLPALVDWFCKRASYKVKSFVAEVAGPVVDCVEIASAHFDWKGEDKLMAAVRRLNELIEAKIGRPLREAEKAFAVEEVDRTVRLRNREASRIHHKKWTAEMARTHFDYIKRVTETTGGDRG